MRFDNILFILNVSDRVKLFVIHIWMDLRVGGRVHGEHEIHISLV